MQIPHLIPNHFRVLLSGKLRLREVSGQAGAQTRALRVFMAPACFSECKETSLPTLETSGSGDSGCSAASCEDVPGRCCQLDFQSAWGGGLGLPPRPQTGLVTTGPRGSSRERSLGPDRGARGTGALGGRCCVPRRRQGNETQKTKVTCPRSRGMPRSEPGCPAWLTPQGCWEDARMGETGLEPSVSALGLAVRSPLSDSWRLGTPGCSEQPLGLASVFLVPQDRWAPL